MSLDNSYKLPVLNHIGKLGPNIELLHERFGHCSYRRLSQLSKCVERLPNVKQDPLRTTYDCEACNAGKAKKRAFAKRSERKFTYFGERLSSDICGPFPSSINGYIYLLCIVDGYSSYLHVIPLKTKSSDEVREALKLFLVENKAYLPPPNTSPVTWHTDNGGEFISTDLDEFCIEFALNRSFSVPYASPQNAHAERMWGILLQCMGAMMYRARIHDSFWTYAAQHACYLHNILPSARFAGANNPYQIKFRSKPDVKHLKVWGCLCWYHLPIHERKSKISPRAVPAIHLGLDTLRKGHIVYVPYLNRITSAYHLTFQESSFLDFDDDGVAHLPKNVKRMNQSSKLYKEARDLKSTIDRLRNNIDIDPDASVEINGNNRIYDENESEPCSNPRCTLNKHSDMVPHSFEQVETRNLGPNPVRHPDQQPHYLEPVLIIEDVTEQKIILNVDEMMSAIETPASYKEAISSKLAPRWRDAMKKEIEDLLKHDTWELVNQKDIPKGHNVAKSKWVYKIKLNKDGSIERFKARFVVCGYSQVQGVDYTHSFSATMRATSFRLLLAIAAGTKLKLDHFDVTSAFTQSEIDSIIYVRPPPGFEQYDKNGKVMMLRLKKALYGTKQASRMWQLKLRTTLINKMRFKNSQTDPILFVKTMTDESRIIVGIYVDDIIVAHKDSNPANLTWFKTEFCKVFRASHLGALSWFLGVEVQQREDYSISISQIQYTHKLIDKFLPAHSNSLVKHASPCNATRFRKLTVAQTDAERDQASSLPYLQIIGSLVYLTTMTRPDLSYHISHLCSFMHSPTREAYQAALDLVLYAYSRPKSLVFVGTSRPPADITDKDVRTKITSASGLLAYSDSSWRNPNDIGHNMFGYVIYFFGSIVSYASKHMKIVALSSAEAEYAASAYTCKEIQFIRNVLKDLEYDISSPTILAVDNEAAIKIANNLGVTARNKHFKDTLHYFRQLVDHRVILPVHVSEKFQRADGMTKCLDVTKFRDWCKLLYDFNAEESQH